MKSLRDQLLGALIGLARASECKEITESAGAAFVDGLTLAFSKTCHIDRASAAKSETAGNCAKLEASNPDAATPASSESVYEMIDRLHEEKALMAPDCAACQYPCGRTFDYDMEEVYGASEALREAKLQLLETLGALAVQAPANSSKEVRQFLSDALFQISCTYEPGQLTEPLRKAEGFKDTNH